MIGRQRSTAAVVVLPSAGGRLVDSGLRTWLGRASIHRRAPGQSRLTRLVDVLGLPHPAGGLAALRMWGQAGERPTVWVAAADPVFLEPRLDHLRLYALGPENVGKADMRSLFDHLQGVLGRDGAIGFARISSCGYVRSSQPFETATEPPEVVDGRLPGEFLPAGEGAAAFRRRLGEIEMALHEADVNLRRQAAGLQPVNSLWIWGGGMAREQRQVPCPPLFTEDPLLRGYWLSCEARIAAWPGSVAEAVAMATGGFAAVPSIAEGDIDALQSCLLAYQAALSARHIDRLVLSFRDGIEAHLVRTDAVRLWRRRSGLFG